MYFNFTKFFKAHNQSSNGLRMVPILTPRMDILPSTLLEICIIWLSKRSKPRMLQLTKLSSLIVQAKRKFKFPLSFIVSNWNNFGFIFFCLKTSHVIDMHSDIFVLVDWKVINNFPGCGLDKFVLLSITCWIWLKCPSLTIYVVRLE